MSTELAVYQNATLEDRFKYARSIASAGDLLPSGLWANVKDPESGLMLNRPSPGKVMLLTETGLMLGLHPMAALRGIDVIEGNPTIKPALMSALIRKAGHVLRIEQTGTVEAGDLAVTVTGIRNDDPDHPYVYTWTPHTAVTAGLLDSYAPDAKGVWSAKARDKNGNAKPWEKYTPRMCRWRALGDVASAGFEDILMGLHYTPEELGAEVNDAGELIPSTEPAAAPDVDWAARIRDAKTADEVLALGREIPATQYTDELQTAVLMRGGELRRAEAAAAEAAEPAAESASSVTVVVVEDDETPEVVVAEAVEDEPAGADEYETEAQRIERERIEQEEFARWKASQGGAA